MSHRDGGKETSLDDILPTQAARTELALLIALATDTMRRNIKAVFDPTQTVNGSGISSPKPSTEESLICLDDHPSEEDTAAAERVRIQRERDLSSTRMQALRRAALSFFDAWQIKVLRRMGEVLGVKSDAVRVARRAHAEAEEQRTKRKADERYWNWAEGFDEASGQSDEKQQHFSAIETRLTQLDEPQRVIILHSLLLMLLSLESYTAHSRVLLLYITNSLRLPLTSLDEHESAIAEGLLKGANQMSADESTKKRAAEDAASRRWKVGFATIAGAALIGVTGGLAAPLLAAGVGTVMGGLGLGATAVSGLLGTLAGSSVLIGGLFGAYGGQMTGRMIDQFAREVEDFRFIPNNEDGPSQHKLRIAIGVSGWLTGEDDIVQPWKVWDRTTIESFPLRWEVNALVRLGESLKSFVTSMAWDVAKIELIKRTLLGSLYAGLWPLGLLRMARVVDNPFSVAKARSDKAGRVLAEALMSKVQGERPVTLVGYSLGARLIYSCLLTLAENNAFGLVESVVLMGSPSPSLAKDWTYLRSVVSGRIVNVHSSDDYILGFLYRTSSVQFGVAGLQPIDGVPGVENVDMSELVQGHTQWRFVVGQVLQKCAFGDVSAEKVQNEIAAMKQADAQQQVRTARTERNLRAQGKAAVVEEESRVFLDVSSISAATNDGDDPGRKDHQPDSSPLISFEDDSSMETRPLTLPLRPAWNQSHSATVMQSGDFQTASGAETRQETHSDTESEPETPDGRIQMVDLDPEPIPDDFELGSGH